ncbi:MAG TPA: endonuclease MutS2 [Candidatus Izemoplasmatales bacterium]|nr:endonuclease MutS2 [Candidatus Izemoplasmatales bacterium]
MFADSQILEFPKILALLRPYAETDLGKKTVLSLTPSADPLEVNHLLEEVLEAKGMIERYDSAPMTGVLDLSEAFQRARVGSTLSIEELQRVVSLVVAVSENQRFIRKIRQLEIPCSVLAGYFDDLVPLPHLKTEIDRCIDPKGTVYDDASEELSQIRGKIRINQKRITDRMESLLRSEAAKLTDTIITLRNNCLVLPVKAEYKNAFKGIIHDQSASRETVFIEPQSCVEWNSELQNLTFSEEAAIERILAKLTAIVQENHTLLSADFAILTGLDVIFAKAKYAIATHSVKPEITEDEILLVNARHPLIPAETVVANTIRFRDYRTIIITGPNTGGKTVALKTLGLLSLMVQSGLLIPVDEWSKTIVFSHVFADIGDEQSIEQSLSTFSSHISKIVTIFDRLEDRSLVLLDELGVGTDPKEGASLAIAILEALRHRDVFAMVTTHYPELKVYAFDKDDVVNASVEFDIDTLRPTYHLQIGTPGTSNALEIATRLGLSPEIVAHAKTVSLSFDDATADIIRKLERQSLELQREIEEHRQAKIRLQEQNEAMEATLADTRLAQNKAFAEMEKAKVALLESAREEAQALIRELDELKKSASFKEHELARLKFDVKNLGSQTLDLQKVNSRKVRAGDIVTVLPYQKTGTVVKTLPDGKFEVQMGILTAKFDESQLDFVKTDVPEPLKGQVKFTRTTEAKMDLDLRGCRFEEAMGMLDKFVDDCLMNNLEFACVIHGYGTGALRKGVQDYIKKNKAIKSSRPGGMNEGGSGVTILYFK